MAPWIIILSQHTLLTILSGLQIHFCVIFWETRHHTQGYVTLGTLVDRGISLAARWTKKAAELGGFRWPVLVMTALEPHNICCCPTWSSNQNGVGRSSCFPGSPIKFLTRRRLKSRWVFEPHMKITESNCWVLLDPECGKTVSWSTRSYIDSSNSCWPYDPKCWRNPRAVYTFPRCEASRGSCCHHKNFLLLVVGPC